MGRAPYAIAVILSGLGLVLSGCQADPALKSAAAARPRPDRPDQTAVLAAHSVVQLDVPYTAGAGPQQMLDLYAPRGTQNAPVVIYIHGGEWTKGDKSEVSFKPRFFNEHGIILISTNYRLSGTAQHPAQVNDIALAIRWVQQHIGEYGGDPAKIVLMGHSAGCHLVMLVGLDPRPLATVGLKPADLMAVVSWSGGAFDLPAKVAQGGMYARYIHTNFGDAPAAWKDASPIDHIGEARPMPPFLMVSAAKDHAASIAASRDMAQRLAAAGARARFVLLPGADKTHFTADYELGKPGDPTGQILLDFIQDAQAH